MGVKKINIAVVHGGNSSESTISTKNAKHIATALVENGHTVSMIEFDENVYMNLKESKSQLVFIAVQGKYHGDGTLQAICEHLKLPYTGSKASAAAVINDKCVCKKICNYHGIKTPEFIYINKKDFFSVPKENFLEQIESRIKYPFVSKGIAQGGSFGIEYIESREDYEKIARTFEFDDEIIIERFIKGTFVTTPMLEIENKVVPLTTVSAENLVDEQEELLLFNKTFIVKDSHLEEGLKEKINNISIEVFNILSAKNYARIDYMIEDETGIPYFIEINAVPGLKPESFYPQAAKKYGINFNDLIEIIVENEFRGIKHEKP